MNAIFRKLWQAFTSNFNNSLIKTMAQKSNAYTDHHYVPETYMKNFCGVFKKQKGVYWFPRKDILEPLPSHLDFKSPAQICKQDHLYVVKDFEVLSYFNITDPNAIETQAFKEFENNYTKILLKIRKDSSDSLSQISVSEAETLARGLLTMKMRNPYYMFNPDKIKSVQQVNDELKQNILDNYSRYSREFVNLGESVDSVLNELDRRTLNKEYPADLIRGLMLQNLDHSPDSMQSQLTNLMLSKKWYIYQTQKNTTFITSDNPGVMLSGKKRFPSNLDFLGKFEFTFPLSSTETLVIDSSFNDTSENLNKKIHIVNAIEGYVKKTNYNTILNTYQYVYCREQSILLQTLSDFKKLHPWFRHQ